MAVWEGGPPLLGQAIGQGIDGGADQQAKDDEQHNGHGARLYLRLPVGLGATMRPVTEQLPQPDLDRLGMLAALVILAYGLTRVVELPTLAGQLTVFGLLIPLTLDTRSVMLILAAGLAVVGADWLTLSHPAAGPRPYAFERWIVPAVAALGVGALLTRLPEGPVLWIGLPVAAALLIAVFVAEFIVLGQEDPRRAWAVRALELLALLLLLQGVFFLRLAGVRAIFIIPGTLVIGSALAWRLFLLRRPDRSPRPHALAVGWGVAQLAWGLHYWPLPPLQGSLLLVLGFYLGLSAAGDLLEAGPAAGRWREYLLVGAAGVALILLLA